MAQPTLVEQFAEIVGWEGAMLIVQIAGGQSRRLPQVPTEEHWLSALLGVERARALCRIYGGTVVQIPKGAADALDYRNHKIREERRAGELVRNLASKYALTERQIYSILGAEG